MKWNQNPDHRCYLTDLIYTEPRHVYAKIGVNGFQTNATGVKAGAGGSSLKMTRDQTEITHTPPTRVAHPEDMFSDGRPHIS